MRGKLGKDSEENSSVALLSLACIQILSKEFSIIEILISFKNKKISWQIKFMIRNIRIKIFLQNKFHSFHGPTIQRDAEEDHGQWTAQYV